MSAQTFVNTFVDTMRAIRGIIPIVRNIHVCACVHVGVCTRTAHVLVRASMYLHVYTCMQHLGVCDCWQSPERWSGVPLQEICPMSRTCFQRQPREVLQVNGVHADLLH